MSDSTALGAGEEFDAIRRMTERWGSLATGIGDDAAALEIPRGDQLLTSVDTSIEGRHFRREWLSAREIANRAVVAAMSDLAAMAALPLGILVALGVPASWRDALDDIADGVGDAARATGARMLGGNLSDAGELSITTTVLGHAYRPLRRRGARIGDAIFVTGELGGSGAALDALVEGRRPDASHRARFASPTARLLEARWLAAEGARGGIDISDGVGGDLEHLARASGVCIEASAADLPVIAGVTAARALRSGEEYELIVAAPASLDVASFRARFGIPLTRIGSVVRGEPGVQWAGAADAGAFVAARQGHDHFSS